MEEGCMVLQTVAHLQTLIGIKFGPCALIDYVSSCNLLSLLMLS